MLSPRSMQRKGNIVRFDSGRGGGLMEDKENRPFKDAALPALRGAWSSPGGRGLKRRLLQEVDPNRGLGAPGSGKPSGIAAERLTHSAGFTKNNVASRLIGSAHKHAKGPRPVEDQEELEALLGEESGEQTVRGSGASAHRA